MTQYDRLNVKLNELKSAVKNETSVVLRLLSNIIGNFDDETIFSFKLLFNRQAANLPKSLANSLSVNIKLSKIQLSKIVLSGGFLGELLGPLLKTGLPLMKNVIQTSAIFYSISVDSSSIRSRCSNTYEYLMFWIL